MLELKLFVGALISLLCIDGIWLGLIAKNWYQQTMGPLMKTQVNWLAVLAFYLIYSFGLVYLIQLPALKNHSTALQVAFNGFVLGFIAYGTYDLTNLAILKNWPVFISFVDMVWGGLLTATVCWLVFYFFIARVQ